MKSTIVKASLVTIGALILIAMSTTAAATIEIKFVEPKKFHDVDITGYNKNKGIELLKTQLQRLFTQVSKDVISDTDTLTIEVTDIDLAGYMQFFFGDTNRDIRIIRNHDRFRLEFKYQLTSNTGEVSKQGDEVIKRFIEIRPNRVKNYKYHTVGYMQKDLEKWFEVTFAQ